MQRMVQVKDNQIIKHSLPKTGQLKDGSTVSGYDILPLEILLDEGWLPLEDIKPTYDKETQYLLDDGYEILTDKVIKKYKVEDIVIETIPQEPSETEKLRLEQAQANVEMIELLMSMTGGM
ncbi:hypothetical protein CIW83_18495 [Tissierella sp. P1]|uniref:hypothetical protein n=1 Tax=Tissierella sp. P1 TaxID=1280483 RepID=UPI000BA0A4B2|nr:hypothetical protein [Tissierella sp. P1]OZV10808.1 hypothetical protein CIW83_18495 [Tissierella sp. P1]